MLYKYCLEQFETDDASRWCLKNLLVIPHTGLYEQDEWLQQVKPVSVVTGIWLLYKFTLETVNLPFNVAQLHFLLLHNSPMQTASKSLPLGLEQRLD